MDSNNLLTDFLDDYFNDPLSDDNKSILRNSESQFFPYGLSSDQDTFMSTPNHLMNMDEATVSPSYEINYGPMMSHVDAFISSSPSSNPLYLEKSDPNTVLNDILKSPDSPSSSTISIRSPIPPPTPSPERLQYLPDIDLNNNSNETISADEEDSFNPELGEKSRLSQPSPLMQSASPLLTFTIPDNVMIRSDDVLEHHFDVQLSPAMAAPCIDTSAYVLSLDQPHVGDRLEPVEIYTMQGTNIMRRTEHVLSPKYRPCISDSDEKFCGTSQGKPLIVNPVPGTSTRFFPMSSEAIQSPRCFRRPIVQEDNEGFADKVGKIIPDSPPGPVPVFKTDLNRFASRPPRASVIVSASQVGQNSIPLAKDSGQRERLWHVEPDDPFMDVPVVKSAPAPKKKRGRPKGSKNKPKPSANAAEVSVTPSTVCARCVELLQQIR